MSFLLMIFLTLVCLYEDYPVPPWKHSPGWSVLFTFLGVLVVAGHAFWVSRRVSWPLSRDPSRRDALLKRYEHGRFVQQILQVGMFVLALTVLGWGWAVRDLWVYHKTTLPGLELLTLSPFILSQLLTWILFYDADRAAHRAAHRGMEADSFAQTWLESRQAHTVPFDGRWSYVAFQARQKLALVFIPVLLLIIYKEFSRLFPLLGAPTGATQFGQFLSASLSLLGIIGLASVFICMPLIIRVLLNLKPLPAGPIRDRLLAASKRLHFRTSDILLWNTRSCMANAMVVGLVPWLRYVVFTDRLLEEFSEDEVEAVFGHEVGHVQHQHMIYYLMFLTGSILVLGLLADAYLRPMIESLLPKLAAEAAREPVRPGSDVMIFPIVGLLLAYIFVVFGFLSRRCERQADVFGCRAVSCGDPCCRGHDDQTKLTECGEGLCVTGIGTFIRALEKVALVNGINRDRPGFFQSWQHSTIAKRVDFLDRVIIDREVEAKFQRRLTRMKWGLMIVLTVAVGVLVAVQGWKW